MMMKRKMKPVHPGRVLLDEIMRQANLTQSQLAQAAGLSKTQVGSLVRGQRRVTAEIALRLERALGVSAETWLNLQTLYDLERTSAESGKRIKQTTMRISLSNAA